MQAPTHHPRPFPVANGRESWVFDGLNSQRLSRVYKTSLGRAFFLTLLVPLALIVSAGTIINGDSAEVNGTILSTLVALMCWFSSGWFLTVRAFGRRFFGVLTLLLLVRITANLIHFYCVFAPLAGIDSSSALPEADFSGDLGAIYNSATIFADAYETRGLYYALVGDYYRGINNPGVGVIYGGLFSAFGRFASVAIPWTVLYSAFGALLIGFIGSVQQLPVGLCRTTVIMIFCMPGFFIFPPVYRDNYILFLLALTAYSSILLTSSNLLLVSVVLAGESILLLGLRMVYVFIPFAFGGVVTFLNAQRGSRAFNRKILFGVIAICAILLSWNFLAPYRELSSAGFTAEGQVQESGFAILAPFKARGFLIYYPAAAVFSLLAPMPWWQPLPPALMSYQVFSYAQTWYSLTAFVALVYSYRLEMTSQWRTTLVLFYSIIFSLALFGSFNFNSAYTQIATPFIVLSSIRYNSSNWKTCFALSTSIILIVHFILLIR